LSISARKIKNFCVITVYGQKNRQNLEISPYIFFKKIRDR
jgi:hypothetical protein